MPFAIRIKEVNNHAIPWRFEKRFRDGDELQTVLNLCSNKKRLTPIQIALGLVRTDSCSNFAKDFFFPTFIHEALKIQDFANKLFVAIGCVILDLLTLPIRILTLLPRFISNWGNTKQKHPLHQYLAEQNADGRILIPDQVYLQIEKEVNGSSKKYGQTFNYSEQIGEFPVERTVQAEVFSPDDLIFLLQS